VRQVTKNPGLAALSFVGALALSTEKNQEIGQTICGFHRVHLFHKQSHALVDRLKQLLSLANRFL
jgi:hypothetical protein